MNMLQTIFIINISIEKCGFMLLLIIIKKCIIATDQFVEKVFVIFWDTLFYWGMTNFETLHPLNTDTSAFCISI